MSVNMIDVTILVEDEYRNRMNEVSSALKDLGFVENESLSSLGVISGSILKDKLAKLA